MSYAYVGRELEVFSQATNWKRYFSSLIRPFLRGDVLEVGAGLGGTTAFLRSGRESSWTCLEPDAALAYRLAAAAGNGDGPEPTVINGTIADVPAGLRFDAIVYIDVLEHSTSDTDELHSARGRLRRGGHLVVLSPAHQWLFSPFDAAIGHERRYSLRRLVQAAPPGMTLVLGRYIDACGLLLSMGNAFLLRHAQPTFGQVRFWDRYAVRASMAIDRVLGWRVGKSVLCVWREPRHDGGT